jgi:hypothetical protein
MFANFDSTQVRQRGSHSDHSVSAHAEISGIVKEDDPRRGCRIYRLNQQRADKDIGTARFTQDCAPVNVVPGA